MVRHPNSLEEFGGGIKKIIAMKLKIAVWNNLLYTAIQFSLPILSMSWMAHALGSYGFGELSWVENVSRLIALFFSLGIPLYGHKALQCCKTANEKRDVLLVILRFHLLITLFVGAGMGIYFFQYEHRRFFPWPVVYLVSQLLQLEWYFQAIQRYDFLIKRSLFIRLVSLVMVMIWVKSPEDVITGFSFICLTQLILGLSNIFYLNREVEFHKLFQIKRKIRLDKSLLYLSISSVFVTIYTMLDTVVLRYFSDFRFVGNYFLSLRIAKMPMLVLGAMVPIFLMQLVADHQKKSITEYFKNLEMSFKTMIIVAIPIVFCVFENATQIVMIMGGDSFSSGSVFLRLLIWILPLTIISNVFGYQLLVSMDRERNYGFISMIGFLVALISFFSLIPSYGPLGAAYAVFITEFSVACMSLLYARSVLNVRGNVAYLMKWLFCFIPFGFLLHELNGLIPDGILILCIDFVVMGLYGLVCVKFIFKDLWFFDWFTIRKRHGE
jgi:O-antigen/teichoic acid export membrane protein